MGPQDAYWALLPIPAVRVRQDGRLSDPNGELLAQVGMTESELSGRDLFSIAEKCTAGALLAEQDLPRGVECRLLRKDGTLLEVLAHRRSLAPGEWIVTFTPMQESQEALREAHRRTRNILESISDGFVGLDHAWRYTFVNHRAGAMFGRDPADLVGKKIWDEFPDGVGQPFQLAYERAMKEQVPLSIESFYAPWNRWFENRIYPSPDGLTIFFTEISDRKRIDEEVRASRDRLRALSAQLQRVRERDNARLAREIHDRMGQPLVALDLAVTALSHKVTADQGLEAALIELRALIHGALDSERQITSELRPAILDELGLIPALEWFGEEFHRHTGIECRLRHQGALPAPASPEPSTALFRIFQDALSNIARHSGARRVEVLLASRGSALVLEIEDDGRGMPPEALQRPIPLGLLGMQERAAALGGEVRIGPRPGGGTRVVARVPWEASDKV